MMSHTTKPDSSQPTAEMAVELFDNWFDPIETQCGLGARAFIEELIRGELDTLLVGPRPRYGRSQMAGDEESAVVTGHRHGSRKRSLTGTFGPIEIAVPRARLNTADDKTTEWKSQALRAYQRRTLAADALIAGAYLAGTNTRRVRHDGAPGLDKAIAAVWDGVPVQRCTVHKHRNLLAHAPERLHEEIGSDYSDMIYAATPEDIEIALQGRLDIASLFP